MAWQFMNLHAARLINKINTLTSTEVTKINSNRVVYSTALETVLMRLLAPHAVLL